MLEAWLSSHPGGRQLFCLASESTTSQSTGATLLTPDMATDHFNRTIADSKWEVIRGWHVFRHSFASNCASAGVDQRFIDSWMGHQTDEMRKRYRHLFPTTQATALAQVFGSGPEK